MRSGFFGLRGQYLLRHAMTVNSAREPAINRHLPQDSGKLVWRKPVAQCSAEMRLKLVHAAEASDHSKVEKAAIPRLERVIAPHRTPTICGQQFLKLAVEVIGIRDRAIYIFVPENPAAHRHPPVVQCLVHRCFLLLWRRPWP